MRLAIASWKELLDGISRTHTTRPDVSPGNVVKIPNALDRLKDAILHVIRERNDAERELNGIHEAMQTLEMEVTAALEKNTIRRRDVMLRLNALQLEMASAMSELEIKCEVPVNPASLFKPTQEDEK